MTDKTSDTSHNTSHDEGGAAHRPEVGDTDQPQTDKTLSGREAFRVPPGKHDREHQSEYGGGGENGGADRNNS
jgi:hypothetical protein